MTAYTSISNALVAVGAKPFATTVQALRDNPIAIAEADSTALVNQTAWHPYNKVTNGDANDGKIYDFAVDGSLSTVVSPDFADGYEYSFRLDRLSHSFVSTALLRIELYNETAGSYGAVQDVSASVAANILLSGVVEIYLPRGVFRGVRCFSSLGEVGSTGNATATVTNWLSVHTTPQKRLRARFSFDNGNIDQGIIFMDRRRAII